MPPPQGPHILVSCLLLLSFFHLAAATAVAHTLDTTFSNGSALVLDTVIFRLLGLFSWIIDGFFTFLQRSDMPPWLFYILASTCMSSRMCQALLAVLTAAFDAGSRLLESWLADRKNATIAELQQQLSMYYHLDTIKDQFQSYASQITWLEQEREALTSSLLRSNGELRTLQDANTNLQNDLNSTLYENNRLHNSPAARQRRRMEESHKLEMTRLKESNLDQADKITDLESKVNLWKTQWQQHDCTNFSRPEQEHQAAIDGKNDELHLANTMINSLTNEKHHLNTINHGLQQQSTMFNSLKEILLRCVEEGVERQQIAAIICIGAFLHFGIDIAELGIDPLQFRTYWDWAIAAIDNLPSAVLPTTSLRLNGTRFLLSRSFIRGTGTFGANEAFFIQAPCPPQTHWTPPQPASTNYSNPAVALDTSNNTSSTSVFQGFQAQPSSTQPFGFNTATPTTLSGSSNCASLITQYDPPTPAVKPVFNFLNYGLSGVPPANPPNKDEEGTAPSAIEKGKQKDPVFYGNGTFDSIPGDGAGSTPQSGFALNTGSGFGNGASAGAGDDDNDEPIDPDDMFKLESEKKGSPSSKRSAMPPKLDDPMDDFDRRHGDGSSGSHGSQRRWR